MLYCNPSAKRGGNRYISEAYRVGSVACLANSRPMRNPALMKNKST